MTKDQASRNKVTGKALAETTDAVLEELEADRIRKLEHSVALHRERRERWTRAARRLAYTVDEKEAAAQLLKARIAVEDEIAENLAEGIAITKARPEVAEDGWGLVGTLRSPDGAVPPDHELVLATSSRGDCEVLAASRVDSPYGTFSLKLTSPLPEAVYVHVLDADGHPVQVVADSVSPTPAQLVRMDILLDGSKAPPGKRSKRPKAPEEPTPPEPKAPEEPKGPRPGRGKG
jgi:hypothetical protein